MVREFYIENETGQRFSMMDIEKGCFLSSPDGLGYSYDTSYSQIGYKFIQTIRQLEQGKIQGELIFNSYDNFKKIVDFIENSNNLKLGYVIPFKDGKKEYFRDVQIQSLSKTQIQTNGVISEIISLDCLSLWYQDKETVYEIGVLNEQEMQWDFMWDTRFADYRSRSIVFDNDGHVEAPIKIELCGHLINPVIFIMVNGIEKANLAIPITLQKDEKLLYSSVDNDIYLKKQNADGTYENLFKQQYIDLKNNNIFKVPKGTSEITLTADNNIINAKVNIYKQYKVV